MHEADTVPIKADIVLTNISFAVIIIPRIVLNRGQASTAKNRQHL